MRAKHTQKDAESEESEIQATDPTPCRVVSVAEKQMGWGSSGPLPPKLSVATCLRCQSHREHRGAIPRSAGPLTKPLPPSAPHSPVSSPLASHPRGQTPSGPRWGRWSVSAPGQDCRGAGEERMRALQDDISSERSTENTARPTTLWGQTTSKPTPPALPAFTHSVRLTPRLWSPGSREMPDPRRCAQRGQTHHVCLTI